MADSVVNQVENNSTKTPAFFKIVPKDFAVRVLSLLIFAPIIWIVCFGSEQAFLALCLVASFEIIREVVGSGERNKPGLRLLFLMFCLAGVCSFAFCRKVYGVPACMFLICITSFTDTGAYCVGRIFKGPKLCPKISPQKTWSGFFGGILFANIAYFLIRKLFLIYSFGSDLLMSTIMNNFIIVQVIVFSAIVGDLLESFFKRRIGVKDIGKIFPGHGGMLDRFDSLILASIVFLAIAFWIEF